jgi:hypothetical protein
MNTAAIQQSTPVSLTEAVTTHFHMPTDYLRVCDKYYVLYWQARFLYTQLLRSPRIVRESISYVPVLQEGLSLQEIQIHRFVCHSDESKDTELVM